jgi:hypothetical protein
LAALFQASKVIIIHKGGGYLSATSDEFSIRSGCEGYAVQRLVVQRTFCFAENPATTVKLDALRINQINHEYLL